MKRSGSITVAQAMLPPTAVNVGGQVASSRSREHLHALRARASANAQAHAVRLGNIERRLFRELEAVHGFEMHGVEPVADHEVRMTADPSRRQAEVPHAATPGPLGMSGTSNAGSGPLKTQTRPQRSRTG